MKDEFTDLVDYYYEKLEDCTSLKEVVELNWYCKDRMVNLAYKSFNETWDTGWCLKKND